MGGQSVLDAMGAKVQFEVEVPDPEKSDLAVPCFPMAKALRRNPAEIAEEIVSKLPPMPTIAQGMGGQGLSQFQDQRGIPGPNDHQGDHIDQDRLWQGSPKDARVLLEHTSVNPTGPLHVGRARNPLIGDTLARCLRTCGYDVTTEYLVNDVGKQVVLLTWGVQNVPDSEVPDIREGQGRPPAGRLLPEGQQRDGGRPGGRRSRSPDAAALRARRPGGHRSR